MSDAIVALLLWPMPAVAGVVGYILWRRGGFAPGRDRRVAVATLAIAPFAWVLAAAIALQTGALLLRTGAALLSALAGFVR